MGNIPENRNDEVFKFDLPGYSELRKEQTKTGIQYLICITACTPILILGIFHGFTSSMLQRIREGQFEFPTNEKDAATLTNTSSTVTVLGPLIYTYLNNQFGRKFALRALYIPTVIGLAIIYLSENITEFIIGSAFCNLTDFVSLTLIGIYVGEISAPHLRASLGNTLCLYNSLGKAFGIFTDWLLDLKQGVMVLLIITLLFLAAQWNIPETPYYLIRKKRYVEAETSLKKIYGSDVANCEYNRLLNASNKSIGISRNALRALLSIPSNRIALILVLGLYFTKFGTGAVLVTSFSAVFLHQGNYSYLTPELCQLMLSLVTIPFSLLATYLMHRINSRVMYLSSAFSVLTCHVLLSIYFFSYHMNYGFVAFFHDIFPFVLLALLNISLNLGVGTYPNVYFRELISIEVLGICNIIVDFFLPLLASGLTRAANFMLDQHSVEAIFVMFVIFNIAGILLFMFLIPETKGKTLEEIQKNIESGKIE